MDGVNWKTGVNELVLTFYRFVFGTPSRLISVSELRGGIKKRGIVDTKAWEMRAAAYGDHVFHKLAGLTAFSKTVVPFSSVAHSTLPATASDR